MKISIKIEHETTGEHIVTTMPADLMRWERLTKSKLTHLVTVRKVDGNDEVTLNIGAEDMMAMAWSVMTRKGFTAEKFDAWANGLTNIELVGIDETNPTQTAASTEQ